MFWKCLVDIYIAGFFILSLNAERATVAVDGNFGSYSVTGVLLTTRKKSRTNTQNLCIQIKNSWSIIKKNSGSVNKGWNIVVVFFFSLFSRKIYTLCSEESRGANSPPAGKKTTTLYHRSIYLSHSSENRTTDTVLPIVHKHPSCIVTSVFQHYHNSLIIFFLHVKRTV